MLFRTLIIGALTFLPLLGCHPSSLSDPERKSRAIRVIGSSTVYPFSTKVAQEFKNQTGYNVIVEATGSGGGHKLFCEGVGPGTPDMTNSSRRQKTTEFDHCAENGVTDIIEVKIGYDGIVIANALDAPQFNLRTKDIYMAFAKYIPTSDEDCTLHENPYRKWSDLNADLPDFQIEVYGPPPTSGTRDAFVEIAMENGARMVPCLAKLYETDREAFLKAAHILREDGAWIDAGESDNALVQTLLNTPTALGVLGYSFLDQNEDKIKAAKIGGVAPEFAKISSGEYPVSRSLFVYFKKANVKTTPGLKELAIELLSDRASGKGGYLNEIGLVPLSEAEREKYRRDVRMLHVNHP
ncbi:phosphate ABC transporter substrate-binding protein (PhoT family) [Litorimonas taeanensis]|uniref:Phosphate ABC transporter substrate-binding protein (PhoT family) n=1 Tax=Litorimonas taeanensis TaxID=568099 RepID=A0A420WIE5_9PROT|nr:substrate-binding domain-containing protein [Litorimonas taeanensis]RKQ70763.1 phosphate ABC transporter substrate-binding protein (PhoT family) [Litorimonas taeanensis]